MSEALLDAVAATPAWLVRGWLFAFGLVLGSFLNVVIHRVPRGRSIVRPRSACPACGRMLPWYENVPVLSWLALRGRCAGCGLPISPRYALVELLTAGLVLASWEVFGPGRAFLVAVLFAGFIVSLVFTDLELMLLPDAITLPGTVLGLALSWWSPLVEPADALAGVVLGIALMEGLNLLYRMARGRDGFGAGDTKMMMLMGAFLGWKLMLFSLLAACLVGTVVALPLVAWARWRSREDAEPTAAEEAAEPSAEARDEPASGSALAGLVPQDRREAVLLLVLLAAAASLVLHGLGALLGSAAGSAVLETAARMLPPPVPALAGLLAGILAMAADSLLARSTGRRISALPELWILAGTMAGLPPTPVTAAVAAGGVLVAALLARRLPPPSGIADAPEEDVPLAAGAGSDRPDLMQAEIPFGVFLGLGALVALLAGEAAIAWYLDLALGSLESTT